MTGNRIKALTVRPANPIPTYLPKGSRPLKSPLKDLPGLQLGTPLTFPKPNRTMAVIGTLTAPKASAKVWAFEHSTCLPESSYAVESLHATKAGAWRAKHAHQFKAEVEAREYRIRYGANLDLSLRHMMGWRVRAHEVQP